MSAANFILVEWSFHYSVGVNNSFNDDEASEFIWALVTVLYGSFYEYIIPGDVIHGGCRFQTVSS